MLSMTDKSWVDVDFLAFTWLQKSFYDILKKPVVD